MGSFIYTMADVLPLLGIDYPSGRTSFNVSCPVCDSGERDKHLNINLKKSTFRCPRCGDVQGGVLDLYALYAGCNRKEAYKAISEHLSLHPQPRPRRSQTEITECEIAPIYQRDTVYRALLSLLSLSPMHIENLRNRGLDDTQISFYGFKSVDPDEVPDLGAILHQKGYCLDGVPGFYLMSGIWRFRCDYSGILIPVLDTEQKIQGLQLRLDNKEQRKFRWVSSGGLHHGTAALSYSHFIGDQSKTVLLTEGPMKADIINALTGMTVIAIPGVNCLTQLDAALRTLKARGTNHIMIAFDMDFASNQHVQNGYSRLLDCLDNVGLKYGTYVWDPAYKGLDDYIWLHNR